MLNSIQRADGKRRTWNTGNKYAVLFLDQDLNTVEDLSTHAGFVQNLKVLEFVNLKTKTRGFESP